MTVTRTATVADLLAFIDDRENRLFSTFVAYSENPVYLEAWNAVRCLAGLPELSLQDVLAQAPRVSGGLVLGPERRTPEQIAMATCDFADFSAWLAQQYASSAVQVSAGAA